MIRTNTLLNAAAMTASLPLGDTPRLAMLIVGPVIGVVSGVVIGLLGVLAARLTRGARALRPGM